MREWVISRGATAFRRGNPEHTSGIFWTETGFPSRTWATSLQLHPTNKNENLPPNPFTRSRCDDGSFADRFFAERQCSSVLRRNHRYWRELSGRGQRRHPRRSEQLSR